MSASIPVKISDLKKLSQLISDADYRDKAPSIELITKMHEMVEKMAGQHACAIYADDEQKPNLRLVVSNDSLPAIH